MINSRNIKDKSFGGLQVLQRNYNALRRKNSVTYFNLFDCYNISALSKRINLLFGRYYALSKENERKVLELCGNMDAVWLDTAQYGRLAKVIKQKYPSKKVATFFHNCEYEYVKQEHPYNLIRQCVIRKNEEWACAYSDKIAALNERDKFAIQKLYGRMADAVIPVSFPNRHMEFSREKTSSVPVALFLGSNFYANIHGIKWFIEKALPFANMKLKIIGKDMDKANLPRSEKLEIMGYVDDLDSHIQSADFMMFPIFIGGGMKVKTCEALMHGKNIIGTGEAFMGYDVDFSKVGAKCETAEEFIAAINEFPKRFTCKFNEYSRNKFLEKYSDDMAFKSLEAFL
jgi:hypothetical protein